MFLSIDIGNSNIVLAIYNGERWSDIIRLETKSDEYLTIPSILKKYIPQIEKSALSSVVPTLTEKVLEVLKSIQIEPLVVNTSVYPRLKIGINNPEEIGTDLVANAVMGHKIAPNDYKIVIDFGTALTFTTLNPTGQIIGVAIAPGLRTAMYSLFNNAEQLPEVPIELPKSALGYDTVSALQAGVVLGYTGLVEGLIKNINKEVGHSCKVIVTGGLSFVMEPIRHLFDVMDVHLTLEGIRNIYEQYYA